MSTWTNVTEHLDAQHGVIARRQLETAGVANSQLRSWVASRRLERAAPRVWRVVGAPVTWHQRLHTGLLSLGRMSWVSHGAAARLHGFDRAPAGAVDFLVIRGHRSVDLEERVHSTRRWGPTDEVVVDGLRVTSATRTILDLANARAHPDRIRAAIDTAVRLELSSPEAIRLRLDQLRGRGRVGVRQIEDLLEDAGGHTMLERRFLELMSQAGLPRPETQVVLRTPGDARFVARVDFLYPEHGVVIEVSGQLGHASPSERSRDAQRRNELQDLGLRVYEFTWDDVTKRPLAVVVKIRSLLRDIA